MPPIVDRPTGDEFKLLQAAANAGDLHALARIRSILKEYPDICRTLGDLSKRSEEAVIKLFDFGDLAMSEAMKQQMALKRDELGYERATALEKLLHRAGRADLGSVAALRFPAFKANPGKPRILLLARLGVPCAQDARSIAS